MAPAPCCNAIGPSSNMPLFAVVWPLRTTVMSRPFAVTSHFDYHVSFTPAASIICLARIARADSTLVSVSTMAPLA